MPKWTQTLGKVETVSVVNGVLASSADGRPQRGGGEQQQQQQQPQQRLRAEPAGTQAELLRIQHEAAGVGSIAQMPGDDGEERPHMWGPEEITVEDTGAVLRNPGAGLDIGAGRSRRATSTGRPDEEEEMGSPEVEMKDSGEEHAQSEAGSEDKKLDQEDEEMADE